MTGEREGTPRLEPCPFCGGEASVWRDTESREHEWWGVGCLAQVGDEDCPGFRTWMGSREAAIGIWNRRAGARTSPALKEIVERMRTRAKSNLEGREQSPVKRGELARFAEEIERAASLTARETAFFEAAKNFCELWTRGHRNSFKESIPSALAKSRGRLYAAYRALSEGPTQEGS